MQIAPEFDLFYTQDPQTLGDYEALGIRARRCDPATDPELYRPMRVARRVRRPLLRQVDAVPRRARRGARRAASRAGPRVRGRAPLERADASPARHAGGALRGSERRAPGARDRAPRRRRGEVPRRLPHHAARVLRGVLRRAVDHRVVSGAGRLLRAGRDRDLRLGRRPRGQGQELAADETARAAMGRRARQRALREHTWDRRVETFVLDLRKWRAQPQPNRSR